MKKSIPPLTTLYATAQEFDVISSAQHCPMDLRWFRSHSYGWICWD